MIRVAPLPGVGRLLRADRYVLYTADHDPELVAALDAAPDLFKALAQYIVARSFAVTDLALVAVDAPTAVLFGNTGLVADGSEAVSATSTSTWLEVGLRSGDVAAGDHAAVVAREPQAGELNLEAGCIAAAGFVLSRVGPPEAHLASPGAATATTGPSPTDREPESSPTTVDKRPVATGPESVTAWPRPAADDAPLDDQHPALSDPLADPVEFDLERLGSEPSILIAGDDLPAPPPPETPASTLGAAPTTIPPPPVPPPLASVPPPVSPPPASVPPVSPADEVDLSTSDTDRMLPALGEVLVIRFDDGQSVEVTSGLYVGRHPTKGGLPSGFDAVTIRGEQVSRRHWQLVLSDGRATVSDLGSAAGTTVEHPGRPSAPSDAAAAPTASNGTAAVDVAAGDVIRFADRWAIVEGAAGSG